MFQTLEEKGGSGGPQWLSDHPDPGNRYAAITQEAKLLTVRNPVSDVRAFKRDGGSRCLARPLLNFHHELGL